MNSRIFYLLLAVVTWGVWGLKVMASEAPWSVPGAPYRLKLESENIAANRFVNLSKVILPSRLDNGIEVRDRQGHPVPFHWDNSRLCLIVGKRATLPVFLYYGFAAPQHNQRWDAKSDETVPETIELSLKPGMAWINYKSDQEWFDNQCARTRTRLQSRYQDFGENMLRLEQEKNLDTITNGLQKDVEQLYRDRLKTVLSRDRNHPPFYRLPHRGQLATELRRLEEKNQHLPGGSIYERRMKTLLRSIQSLLQQYERTINGYRERMPGILAQTIVDSVDRTRQQRQRDRGFGGPPPGGGAGQPGQRAGGPPPGGGFGGFGGFGGPAWNAVTAADEVKVDNSGGEFRFNNISLFTGSLIVPVDGNYVFAINTNSSGLLYLDGKKIIDWCGVHEPKPDWSKNVSLKLKKGLHEFKFYYHRANRDAVAEAAWKKAEDKDFTRLTATDFSPGWPLKITAITAGDGKSFPLVRRRPQSLLLTDKYTRTDWQKCTVESPSAPPDTWQWLMNDRVIASGTTADLFFSGQNAASFTLKNRNGTTAPLAIQIPPNDIRLSNDRAVYPDLSLKLWLPLFIFDDETLDMYWEITAQMPHDLDCTLEIEPDRTDGDIFPPHTATYRIPAWTKDDEAQFRPARVIKEKIVLPGNRFASGRSVTITVSVPGLVFDRQIVKFVPSDQCAMLKTNAEDTLIDGENAWVVPVLHRPALEELRKWELPRQLEKNLSRSNRILVIGNDFSLNGEALFSSMEKQLQTQERKLDTGSWNNTAEAGSPMTAFPPLLRQVSATNADTIIIVPPVNYRELPVREMQRLLSALVQSAQNNNGIRRIYLCTPYPSLNSEDTEAVAVVRSLCRAYGIVSLDLNAFLRSLPNWQNLYRRDSDVLQEEFPVKAVHQTARFLLQSFN